MRNSYQQLHCELIKKHLIKDAPPTSCAQNSEAITAAQSIYELTGHHVTNAFGINDLQPIVKVIDGNKYLFPRNCEFYCKDVKEMDKYLIEKTYDVIVLDPPWWNKYIRRKKAKTEHGYKMMYSDDLKDIPIEKLLSQNGLVVVWCTNSQQHLDNLLNGVFKQWKVQLVSKWYWMKVRVL